MLKFKKILFYLFFILFFTIILFFVFTNFSHAFGEPKLVSKINSAFEDIEGWILKISRIRTGKKIIKGSLFSYAFILAIDLILSAIKSLIS